MRIAAPTSAAVYYKGDKKEANIFTIVARTSPTSHGVNCEANTSLLHKG